MGERCDCKFASTGLRRTPSGGYEGQVLLPYLSGQSCKGNDSCALDQTPSPVCQDGRCYAPIPVFEDGRADGFTAVAPVAVSAGCVYASYPTAGNSVEDMAKRCATDPQCAAFSASIGPRDASSAFRFYRGVPPMRDIRAVGIWEKPASRLFVKNENVTDSPPTEGCGYLGPSPPGPGGMAAWMIALIVAGALLVLAGLGYVVYMRYSGRI